MDDEDEQLHVYGTPLDPLDENEIPSKKPFAIEDQIVTDENGKRRFHGAFTGGFSAGFWNTVGSLEGWKPKDFKSSRSEKAPQRVQQKPEDFMDDEDLGQFGIAPQRIQAQRDFQIESNASSTSRKRKFLQPGLAPGVIPGVPVLAQLLRPVEDKIAVRILKSMGWRPGQGIGPRLTGKEKQKTRERNKREEYILQHYGALKENTNIRSTADDKDNGMDSNGEDEDDDEDELTFAPDDYDPLICVAKTNRFGLGYSGLNREEASTASTSKLEHINLFGPLEMVDKNNKKLSITGQAFGVGALEEEDEDIYARDDMSKYDFSLEGRKTKTKKPSEQHVQDRHIIEGFDSAKKDTQYQPVYAVDLPRDFEPRNWAMRRSRFAPLPVEKLCEIQKTEAYKKRGLGRHDLNPEQRSAILENKPEKQMSTEKQSLEELQQAQRTRNERTKALLEQISAKSDNFTRGGVINTKGEEVSTTKPTEVEKMQEDVEKEQKELLAKATNKTKHLPSQDISKFKPFLGNDAKQQRYEKFLEANLKGENEISEFLATIQPIELSDWDREMEKKEFIQARKIYKPLGGIMSERFVSESTIAAEKHSKPSTAAKDTQSGEDTKKIVVERTKEMWKPHALLCKRYNIAEPFGGSMAETDVKQTRKPKLSIFEYLETSVNKKTDFQTPVIIPKHLEKPRALIDSRRDQQQSTNQNTEKPSTSESASLAPPAEGTKTTTSAPSSSSTAIIPTIEALKHLKLPPKTELEKRVEESIDKPASEKIELFRAIFEDSDDDVDADDATSREEVAELEIEKLNLPPTVKPATAAEMNLLRNNSPPRGIFAALFNTKSAAAPKDQQTTTATTEMGTETEMKAKLKTPSLRDDHPTAAPPKITFKSRLERQKSSAAETEMESDDLYGPKLPQQANKSVTIATDVDAKLLKLFEKHKSTKFVEDVWVERTAGSRHNEASGDDDDDSSTDSGGSSESSKSSSKPHKKTKSKKSKKLSTRKKSKKSNKKKSKTKTKKKAEDIVKSHKSSKKKKKKSK